MSVIENCVTEFSYKPRVKRTKEQMIAAEDLRRKMRDEDSKMVTGVFKNLETPGADLEFTYRKYKEDSFQNYHMYDGQKYTIPLGVAKHINNQTQEKVHAWLVDVNGKKIVGAGNKRQRYQFNSTEFM